MKTRAPVKLSSEYRHYLKMMELPPYQSHLESEYKSCEILLNSLKNENVLRMHKLSEVLEGKVDNEFISKAEYFQSEFIEKAEYIKDMKNDIKFKLESIRCTDDEKPKSDSLRKF